MIRKALYASTWYPVSVKEVKKYFDLSLKPQKAVACISPHAGWIYSGKTAGKVFSSLLPADTYILIGPNHSGSGASTSLFSEGGWELPLGTLSIDEDITKRLMKESEFLENDIRAHVREHSLEVLCPFIQVTNPRAKIVPIIMRDHDREICSDIGRSIAKAVKSFPDKKVILVTSSDMTHYEPANLARILDDSAIDEIINLNPEALLRVVERKGISMCGSGPAAAVLYASQQLGAQKATLVDYSHSGEVTGDNSSVVSYAGIIIT